MTVAEKISICLGLLSVGLALYAIGQAYFYKKQQDKQALVQEAFLKEQRINMSYACIRNREIHRRICDNNGVILRKDKAIIYATSDFGSQYISNNWDQIKEFLIDILKKSACSHVYETINSSGLHQGDRICEVTLRRETTTEDLRKIIEMNEELGHYGLYVSLMIED